MASTDALPVPQKNVAYRVTFPIYKSDGTLITGAAGLDSEISKDAGTAADCTNEATEIATSTGTYYLDLTSTEMNADTVSIVVKTSSTGAVIPVIVMYPEEAGNIRVNATQWNSLTTVSLPLVPTTAGRTLDVSTGGEAGLDWANVGSPTTTVDLSGTTIKTTQKVDVDTIKTNPVVNAGTVTFASNTTVANTAGAVGSVTGAVGSVTGNVGGNVTGTVGSVVGAVGSVTGLTASDVGAIKTKTDSLTFTVSNKVDANALAINGATGAAANLAKTTAVIGRGTVSTSSSNTSITTSAFTPAGAVADQFKGRIVTFDADTTTTALRGQSTDITASTNASTPTLTVTALTTSPASGDTFSVT